MSWLQQFSNWAGNIGQTTQKAAVPGGGITVPDVATPAIGGLKTVSNFGGRLGTMIPGGPIGPTTSTPFGAGQGPVQATGQAADNPFSNVFNFQLPTPDASSGTTSNTAQSTGYGQYVPVIVVGVIVAGLGYYLFQRRKK